MVITASQVNELRQITGAGLMDCKKALTESNGEMEAAIDFLRKKGQKVSSARADRAASEGVVIAQTSNDGRHGVVIRLSCETDFVAKNEAFVAFAKSIADKALEALPAGMEQLVELPLGSVKIQDALADQMAKIGEKIELSSYERLSGECVAPYIHAGNRIGVLVAMNLPKTPEVENIGKDVAMQVAAMMPIAVDKGDVDKTTIERELDIAREQVRAEGKPENMVEKIAEGKLNKFYKESTLLNQQFVKDNSKTVAQVLKDVDAKLTVTHFKRVALG